MHESPRYKRILLKASGEALMGRQNFGIDVSIVDRIAQDIKNARAMGVEIGVVIGGGNIFRGVAVASRGGERVTGDHMGMLATAINSLALRTSLAKIGVEAVTLSAVVMPQISESFRPIPPWVLLLSPTHPRDCHLYFLPSWTSVTVAVRHSQSPFHVQVSTQSSISHIKVSQKGSKSK